VFVVLNISRGRQEWGFYTRTEWLAKGRQLGGNLEAANHVIMPETTLPNGAVPSGKFDLSILPIE